MPKYKITLTSDSPLEASQAMHNAGIPTIGPAMAGYTDSPGPWTVSEHFTAVVEASSPEDAVARIDDVGVDAEIVGGAEPLGE